MLNNNDNFNKIHNTSSNKIDALYLKTLVIDFWLSKNNADLIISEAPFFKGNRRADLIIMQNKYLFGFEIKSELDTLKNLEAQIDDYVKIFDFVYVVLSKKFANATILKKLPTNVGIVIYEDELKIQKEAKIIKATPIKSLSGIPVAEDKDSIPVDKKGKVKYKRYGNVKKAYKAEQKELKRQRKLAKGSK